MDFLTILILAIVEGVTEFLPISSTGHLILFSAALGISENQFIQNFNIIIQFGAILAVLVLYWQRFFPMRAAFYFRIIVSFIPTGIAGFLLKNQIERLLDSVTTVAISLWIGGICLILLDRKAHRQNLEINEISYRVAFFIGIIQSLALIPGVSRAAATILGGLALGLGRKNATEYSFFLGVPTLTAAAAFKAYKAWPTFSVEQIGDLALGTALSFIFAVGSIRFLLHLLKHYGLYHFGWYRIVLGFILLIALSLGYI